MRTPRLPFCDQTAIYVDLVGRVLKQFPRATVLAHDGSGDWKDGYDDAGKNLSSNSRVILAKGDALEQHFRRGWDISLPPPMSESLAMVRASRELRVSTDRYDRIVGFKGAMNHRTRTRAAELLHRPKQGLYVVPTSDKTIDYHQMIASSEFGLVIRGDVAFSYRFTETVCGGSVPVVIADNWVMPFDDLVPFATYGLRVDEDQIERVYNLTAAVTADAANRMRDTALRLCHAHLVTQYHQFDAMLLLAASFHVVWSSDAPASASILTASWWPFEVAHRMASQPDASMAAPC